MNAMAFITRLEEIRARIINGDGNGAVNEIDALIADLDRQTPFDRADAPEKQL